MKGRSIWSVVSDHVDLSTVMDTACDHLNDGHMALLDSLVCATRDLCRRTVERPGLRLAEGVVAMGKLIRNEDQGWCVVRLAGYGS